MLDLRVIHVYRGLQYLSDSRYSLIERRWTLRLCEGRSYATGCTFARERLDSGYSPLSETARWSIGDRPIHELTTTWTSKSCLNALCLLQEQRRSRRATYDQGKHEVVFYLMENRSSKNGLIKTGTTELDFWQGASAIQKNRFGRQRQDAGIVMSSLVKNFSKSEDENGVERM